MKCPKCNKRGFKGRKGISMHIGRVHDKSIVTPSSRKRPVIHLEDHADHAELHSVAVLTRTTTRRAEETVTEQAIVPASPFMVNGCPNCLKPLKPMNDCYTRFGIAPPPFCPFCKCPINAVRTALRIVEKTSLAAA